MTRGLRCMVFHMYITYCVIHISHYITYCVNVYRSKDWMPNYIDNNCTTSVKSRSPAVLAGIVDTVEGTGGTVLLNRFGIIFRL